MDILVYLRATAALGLVLALIWGGFWLLRRYGGGWINQTPQGAEKTMKVVERLELPHRRTLLKIEDEGEQHVLLLSMHGDVHLSSRSDKA